MLWNCSGRIGCTLLGVAAVAGALAACSRPGGPVVTVFAAASLAGPFEAIARAFEREHAGTRVALHCAGSPQLILQLREGAAVDVFASADQPNMQKVVDAGQASAPPVEFARNQLAIVVAAGNRHGVRGLADLARGDLKVALCGPEVPAGRYARQALAKLSVAVASVSDEPSVQAVVGKVQLGEVDAGIVYATDGRGAGVETIHIPVEHNVVASYPIAVLGVGSNRGGGERFVAFVRSAAGRAVLAEHGFGLP
jgi:molybdate transport system substrate-binding protein